jgi:hypothetical protein
MTYIHASGWNIGSQKAQIRKIYNTQLRLRNMKNEERTHCDAHTIKKSWIFKI